MEHNEHHNLDELLNTFFDERMNLTFTAQPATLVEFHKEENTVKVTLDKEGITLDDIPISLFGNPLNYITTPSFIKGKKGLLIFSKHDLNIWVGEGVDKHAKNDFSKNNAFFLIGATNTLNKVNYNMEAIELRSKDKAIELYSKKHTKTESQDKIIEIAQDNIEQTSSKSIKGTATTSIEYNAPKIAIKNSSTNEELFSLLVNSLTTMQNLASELSSSRDTADNSLLTNSAEFTALASEFGSLASKFGGFK